MVLGFLHLVRELVFLAAAVGIAWWCWDTLRNRAGRRDEVAQARLAAERQAADLKLVAERLEARFAEISGRLEAIATLGAKSDALAADKVRVHRLLQATTDSFLSFDEIERGLARDGSANGKGNGNAVLEPLQGDRLRHVLIVLVGDGVVSQMDQDRYLIASDYETDGTDGRPDPGA